MEPKKTPTDIICSMIRTDGSLRKLVQKFVVAELKTAYENAVQKNDYDAVAKLATKIAELETAIKSEDTMNRELSDFYNPPHRK